MAGTEYIRIVEIGPRDGLQNLATFVATDRKIGLIRELAACGLREIPIGGFVHPQAIPQFRDIREVAAGVNGLEGVALTALVPNLRGARVAAACGLRKLNFFFSVSRSHNRSNVRQTPEESLAAPRNRAGAAASLACLSAACVQARAGLEGLPLCRPRYLPTAFRGLRMHQ